MTTCDCGGRVWHAAHRALRHTSPASVSVGPVPSGLGQALGSVRSSVYALGFFSTAISPFPEPPALSFSLGSLFLSLSFSPLVVLPFNRNLVTTVYVTRVILVDTGLSLSSSPFFLSFSIGPIYIPSVHSFLDASILQCRR